MKIRSFIIQWVVVAVVASIAVACSHKPTVGSTQSSSDTCTLERQLLEVVNATPGVMGIAVVSDSDTLVVNGGVRFPMMSVFKLHQALAVARMMEEQGCSLDTVLSIRASELDPDTWSPDLRPYLGKDFTISAGQLIDYALISSDNNASNLLFEHIAMPATVDSIVGTLASDTTFSIRWTEAEMKRDHDLAYENYTSPFSAASLIFNLFRSQQFVGANYQRIKDDLAAVTTGRDRLAAAIEETDSVFFAHKTGSGYRNSRGELAAHNDVGYFRLPDGRDYALAVFIRDFRGTEAEASALIASVAKAVFATLVQN